VVSDLNILVWKGSRIADEKRKLADFALKTRWKQHFPMDKGPLVKGSIANFGIFLDMFEFLHFG
jgi:hypothetical protein